MFDYAPDLLTRKQCQQLLQISKSKMLEFIHEDLIPAHIIAGQFRIEKKRFDRLCTKLLILA